MFSLLLPEEKRFPAVYKMADPNHPLLLKIKSLEKELRDKIEIIKKQERALKDSNRRVERVLKDLQDSTTLIRNIHKSLLPTDLPKIPLFKFSYKLAVSKTGVSGDFFDVIQLNSPVKFGVLLSSCNSYTLSSLFLSLFLKSFPSLKEHKTSGEFLSEMFKNLSSLSTKEEALHIFYGIVSRRDFTLNYCLRGDVFAGIRRARTGEIKSTQSDFEILKPAISPLKDPSKKIAPAFKSAVIELNPKDCLTLCSPGILLRKNLAGTSFGTKNIIKSALSQKGILATRQNILFQANQFAGSAEPKRDQTVLLMEVKDRILKLAKTT